MRGEKTAGPGGRCQSPAGSTELALKYLIGTDQQSNIQFSVVSNVGVGGEERRGEAGVNMSPSLAPSLSALVRLMPETGGDFPISALWETGSSIATCALPPLAPANHRERGTAEPESGGNQD